MLQWQSPSHQVQLLSPLFVGVTSLYADRFVQSNAIEWIIERIPAVPLHTILFQERSNFTRRVARSHDERNAKVHKFRVHIAGVSNNLIAARWKNTNFHDAWTRWKACLWTELRLVIPSFPLLVSGSGKFDEVWSDTRDRVISQSEVLRAFALSETRSSEYLA